jgi:hypothetical protein
MLTTIDWPALHAQLDNCRHLAPEYAPGLSNHLPMLLHALHELGADETRQQDFVAWYLKRYDDVPHAMLGQFLPRWQKHRGDFSRHADLQATFVANIQRQGRAATLQQVLPDLWPGVAAAAFHGLIRTAHAWQAEHDAELAAGLAYWAACWQPLAAPASPVSLADMPFPAWAVALQSHMGESRPEGRLISDRIQRVSQGRAFQQLVSRLVLGPDTLSQLSGFAADHFAHSGNFTVLHMVTSCRAARVLLAVAPKIGHDALQALVPAFTAAFLASGIRHSPAVDPAWLTTTWAEVTARARAVNDDHVAKLVHACAEEEAAYGGPLYLAAARRATAMGAR